MTTFYDPRYHTWNGWASLICEQYAAQSLGLPPEEKYWRVWADAVKGIDLFARNGIPSPDIYEHWQDWAAQFSSIME
jgi:hypothetical protein